MAMSNDRSKVIQVQVPDELKNDLDQISDKTHVPKSVIIRMGIERVIADIKEGKIQMGIRFG